MTDLAKLVVSLEAQNQKYLQKLEQSEKRAKRWEKRTKKSVTNVKNIFGTLAIGAGINSIIKATAEQERAVKQLEQGLITTNGAVGKSLEQLKREAAELQNVTIFGDEQIIDAQAKLVSFTGIADREFSRTIELAADLSTRFGTDLKSSVLQLGKALNDPVANLSALSRSGIQFSTQQRDMIKQLVESNQLVKAQDIILKELEVQFGGSARAARDTLGGAFSSLKNAAGDLLEGDDSLPGVKENIEGLTKLLQDPQIKEGIGAFVNGLITGLGYVIEKIAQVTKGIQDLAKNFASFTTGSFGGFSTDELKKKIEEDKRALAILEKNPRAGRLQGRAKQLRNSINQKQQIVDVRGSFSSPKTSGGTTPTGSAPVDNLSNNANKAASSLKIFQETLDKLNSTTGSLTAENVKFRDVDRLTAEARFAGSQGDNDKAVKLAAEGAKAIQLLKEQGAGSTLQLRGALKELDRIAAKAAEPAKSSDRPVVKAELEIKAEITSAGGTKKVSFSGQDQISEYLKQFETVLGQVAAAEAG